MRQALDNGQARVLGTAIVDGVQTYEIQFASKGGFDSQGPIAYVDQSTYKPVELVDPKPDGGTAHLQVVALEYLPATPANMRLLSLEDRHPGAQVVRGVSSPVTGGK